MYAAIGRVACGALLALACVSRGSYACDNDAQCRRPGREGVCERVGYCAYPDETCVATGLRFSEVAAEFSGMCTTPPPLPSSSETGESVTGDASASDSTSATSVSAEDATDTGETSCGDNIIQEGEECDDANRQEGDGCSNACVLSGAPRWSELFTGAGTGDERATGVTILTQAGLAVTGYLKAASGDDQLWVARIDADTGDQIWSYTRDTESPSRGMGLVQTGSGKLFVTGYTTLATRGRATYLGEFAFEGDNGGQQIAPPCDRPLQLGGRVGNAIATAGNNLAVVGEAGGGQAFVSLHPGACNQYWSHTSMEAADAKFFAASMISATEVWLAGDLGQDVWVARATLREGIVPLATVGGAVGNADGGQAVIVTLEQLLVGGFVDDGTADRDRWIRAYALPPAGRLQTEWTYPGPDGGATRRDDEIEALALAPDGSLIGAGFAKPNRHLLLVKVSASGETIWEREYPEVPSPQATARDVAVGDDGVIYIAGQRTGDDGTDSAWVASFWP